MQNGRWTCQNVANTIQNGRWTCPHVGNPRQNGRWTCQNVANTIQNGRWTCPHVVNPMQNGRWTCPNVANTMQNDKFKFQTVANTRQMVPAKKSKKKSQTCSKKKNPKTISHPFVSHYSSCQTGRRRNSERERIISVRVRVLLEGDWSKEAKEARGFGPFWARPNLRSSFYLLVSWYLDAFSSAWQLSEAEKEKEGRAARPWRLRGLFQHVLTVLVPSLFDLVISSPGSLWKSQCHEHRRKGGFGTGKSEAQGCSEMCQDHPRSSQPWPAVLRVY